MPKGIYIRKAAGLMKDRPRVRLYRSILDGLLANGQITDLEHAQNFPLANSAMGRNEIGRLARHRKGHHV